MQYSLGEFSPKFAKHCFIAPSASVIGQVLAGRDVSIWFNAVVRADNALITLGEGTNVQDAAVLHVDPGVPLKTGKRVTIGHKAMLHGCTIGDGSLIGMNAVVLNHAVIGKNCLIGANALITEGTRIPDGSLVLGSPGKVVRELGEEALKVMREGAQSYVDKIDVYKQHLKATATV